MILVVNTGGAPMKLPRQERRQEPWTCACNVTHPPYLVSCAKCRTGRPKE